MLQRSKNQLFMFFLILFPAFLLTASSEVNTPPCDSSLMVRVVVWGTDVVQNEHSTKTQWELDTVSRQHIQSRGQGALYNPLY